MITPAEIELAREKIRSWPRQDRVDLTDLTEPDVEAVMLLAALLDIRPVDEIPPGAIEI